MNKQIILMVLVWITVPSALLQSMERAENQQPMMCYICNKAMSHADPYLNFDCKSAEKPHVFHIKCLQNTYNQSERCPLEHAVVPEILPTAPRAPEEGPSECCICMDKEPMIIIRPCNHKVCCEICIKQLVEQKQSCPVCRGTIASHGPESKLEKAPITHQDELQAPQAPMPASSSDHSRSRSRNNNQPAGNRHQEQRSHQPPIPHQPQLVHRPRYTCRVCNGLLDDNDRCEINSCGCRYHHACLKNFIYQRDMHVCTCSTELDVPLLTKMLEVSSGDMVRQAIAMGGQSLVHGIATYLTIRSLIASPDIRMGCIEAYLLLCEKRSAKPSDFPVSGIWHNMTNMVNRYSITRFVSNYLLAHRFDVKEISSFHRYERFKTGGFALGIQCALSMFNRDNVLNTRKAQPIIQQSLLLSLTRPIGFLIGLYAGRVLYKQLRTTIVVREEKKLVETFTRALNLMRDSDTLSAGEALLHQGCKLVTVLKGYQWEIC